MPNETWRLGVLHTDTEAFKGRLNIRIRTVAVDAIPAAAAHDA
jgi:hypothetical protein